MPNDEFLFENQTFTIQGFSYRPLDKNSEEMTRKGVGGLPEIKKARTAHSQRGLRLCFMNVILVGMASY